LGTDQRSLIGDSSSADDYIIIDVLNDKFAIEFATTGTVYSIDFDASNYNE